MFLGANRQLDLGGPSRKVPILLNASREYTQQWRIEPWGDGTWHIENVYKGKFLYLDTVEGGTTVSLVGACAAFFFLACPDCRQSLTGG